MKTTQPLLTPWNARRALVPSLAVCLCLVVPAAWAADATPRSSVVQFADLNLTHPEGVQRLYQRISWAAELVCRDAAGRRLDEKGRFRVCVRQSIDHAVAAVGDPALAAFHEAKAGPASKRLPEFAQR